MSGGNNKRKARRSESEDSDSSFRVTYEEHGASNDIQNSEELARANAAPLRSSSRASRPPERFGYQVKT